MIVPIFSVRFCLAETYKTYNGVFATWYYMVLHGTTRLVRHWGRIMNETVKIAYKRQTRLACPIVYKSIDYLC